MTVKITLEFPNADAAIVALGKLTSAAGTMLVEGKPRKGRNDKGVPRKAGAAEAPKAEAVAQGATGANSATLAGATAAQQAGKLAVTESGVTKSDGPSTVAGPVSAAASASPIPAEADVQKTIEKLFEKYPNSEDGIKAVKDALSRFGVARGRDLPEESRAEFIALAEKVLAGDKS
jgi:hypothetical protein